MSVMLLAIVLIGFSRTLYLRPLFDVPDIPPYVYIHGAVLTAWFAWFVVQTSLVASYRTSIHRRLGMVGIGLGVSVEIAGFAAALGLAPRLRAKYGDIESDLSRISLVVWGNLAMMMVFATFLIAALLLRRQPEKHKRLMLLASISIIGPAVGRIGRLPLLDGVPDAMFSLIAMFSMLVALMMFDFVSDRRIHAVSLAGSLYLIACIALGAGLIPNTEFGLAFIDSLK